MLMGVSSIHVKRNQEKSIECIVIKVNLPKAILNNGFTTCENYSSRIKGYDKCFIVLFGADDKVREGSVADHSKDCF